MHCQPRKEDKNPRCKEGEAQTINERRNSDRAAASVASDVCGDAPDTRIGLGFQRACSMGFSNQRAPTTLICTGYECTG